MIFPAEKHSHSASDWSWKDYSTPTLSACINCFSWNWSKPFLQPTYPVTIKKCKYHTCAAHIWKMEVSGQKKVILIKFTNFYSYQTGCPISCINILTTNPSQVCREGSHRHGTRLKTSKLCCDILVCSSLSPAQEGSQHPYLWSETQMEQHSVSFHTTATLLWDQSKSFAK